MFLRLFIADGTGQLLSQKDFFIPFFLWNSGILKVENGYLIYNILKDSINPSNDYQLLLLDPAFKIVKEIKFGKADRIGRDGSATILSDQSILLAFEEWHLNGVERNIRIAKIDKDLSLIWEKEMFMQPDGSYYEDPMIRQSSDSNVYIAYLKTFKRYIDTFNINCTLYKVNNLFDSLWAKTFRVQGDIYNLISFFLGMTDNLYIAGGITKNSGGNYGWFNKMDKSGNVIWNRVLYDPSKKYIDQYFYDAIQTGDGGFAFTGSIKDTFQNNDPTDTNFNIWFVTLDTNGCFNGDCSDTLILNENFTNTINQNQLVLKEIVSFYPNPARDYVDISFIDSSPHVINFYNSEGFSIKTLRVNSEFIEVDLKDLSSGSYYVSIIGKNNHVIKIPFQVIH